MNGAIEKYGYPPCTDEAFRDAVSGGFQQTLRKLLPDDFDREDIFPDICETFRTTYAVHYMDATYPYEGIEEALRELSGMGIRLAVFSNKIHERTVDICRNLLPDIEFDYVLGARDGQPLKPDPPWRCTSAGRWACRRPKPCLSGTATWTSRPHTTPRSAALAVAGVTGTERSWNRREPTQLSNGRTSWSPV